MPVNINEFEVVIDPPRAAAEAAAAEAAASTGAAASLPPRGVTPYEIENILRREKERLARVLAH